MGFEYLIQDFCGVGNDYNGCGSASPSYGVWYVVFTVRNLLTFSPANCKSDQKFKVRHVSLVITTVRFPFDCRCTIDPRRKRRFAPPQIPLLVPDPTTKTQYTQYCVNNQGGLLGRNRQEVPTTRHVSLHVWFYFFVCMRQNHSRWCVCNTRLLC